MRFAAVLALFLTGCAGTSSLVSTSHNAGAAGDGDDARVAVFRADVARAAATPAPVVQTCAPLPVA